MRRHSGRSLAASVADRGVGFHPYAVGFGLIFGDSYSLTTTCNDVLPDFFPQPLVPVTGVDPNRMVTRIPYSPSMSVDDVSDAFVLSIVVPGIAEKFWRTVRSRGPIRSVRVLAFKAPRLQAQSTSPLSLGPRSQLQAVLSAFCSNRLQGQDVTRFSLRKPSTLS